MQPSRGAGSALLVVALTAVLVMAGTAGAQEFLGPPIEVYTQNAGKGARIVPSGQLVIDRHRISCGNRATVLDPNLDDYGAAYPGYLILNPKLLEKVPTSVKLWIHAHECGHQFRGSDEEKADCFAVQRGRRQKWLTAEGLEQVCAFIGPARGDSMHFAGPERCQAMRRCFASSDVE